MNAHAGGDPRQPRPQPAMAFLFYEDRVRQVCLGCSELLVEKGMLVIVDERPINDRQPEYSAITYVIAEGYSLAGCRAVVQDRHIGPPWGEA